MLISEGNDFKLTWGSVWHLTAGLEYVGGRFSERPDVTNIWFYQSGYFLSFKTSACWTVEWDRKDRYLGNKGWLLARRLPTRPGNNKASCSILWANFTSIDLYNFFWRWLPTNHNHLKINQSTQMSLIIGWTHWEKLTVFFHRIALYCGAPWLLESVKTTDKKNGCFSLSVPT